MRVAGFLVLDGLLLINLSRISRQRRNTTASAAAHHIAVEFTTRVVPGEGENGLAGTA